MRALVIDPVVTSSIADLIAYAAAHPMTQAEIVDAMENPGHSRGHDAHHVLHIPIGFRCVYTEELQPIGRCRHLSVSVDGAEGRYPNPVAMAELMALFCFSEAFCDLVRSDDPSAMTAEQAHKVMFWIEREVQAVNVLEKIE